MKIKFNWGTGILISCLIFMTVTVITGITFMNQKVDLVTDNYYEKELKYQDHIDKMNRSELSKDKMNIEIEDKFLQVSFSDSNNTAPIKGEINFYRPSDSMKDFKLSLDLNEDGKQMIKTGNINAGYWKVQVNWTLNDREYYFEKSLIIE